MSKRAVLQAFYKTVYEKYYFDDLLVFMRYKYDFETEWDYSKQLFLFEGDDIGHVWQNDWDEGQQDVEILGFMKIDDVPFLFFIRKNVKRRLKSEILLLRNFPLRHHMRE